MCTTCGCSDEAGARITRLAPAPAASHHLAHHHHSHPDGAHDHGHHDHATDGDAHPAHEHAHDAAPHLHAPQHATTVELEQAVLAKNDRLAERNRGWLAGRNILALNLVSSPGSGKTTLLERTIEELGAELPFSVIEGDQETVNDAERIRRSGCKVVQINTGAGCHLDADMVARGLTRLDPPPDSVLMIENVGNLVCPALFDLGERAKVAIVSVTEGEDKPLKYPHMFRASQVLLVNKIDLLPHVDFDVEKCIEHARLVNPHIDVLQVSARTGEGLSDWYRWLRTRIDRLEWTSGPLPAGGSGCNSFDLA